MKDQNNAQMEQMEQIYKFDPPKEKKKGRRGLKIWLIVLACIVLFGAIIGFSVNALFADRTQLLPTEPYLGVLYVEGVIAKDNVDSWGRAVGYQHDFTLRSIDKMIKDENNKGIILYVDSPGGGVFESDELYFKIEEYKEATGRPVFSYMASMAASGGYYISAPADMIFANRNCWTGSIGVTIGTLFDLSGFLENYGIKTITITSGDNKAMGNMLEPITDEQKAIFQSLIDEAYEQFVEIVAKGRKMDSDTVKKLADGRIYTAKQAMELDLIDSVSTYKEAISYIAEHYNLKGVLLQDITYQDHSIIGKLFNKLPLPSGYGNEAEAVLSLIRGGTEYPISYLSQMP
ncbi:MAG TPA: signal peptide peptidase SppA [Anaerovoracaceae bacterium]|nr:signal peptide peptidase SppA [Anaerovoracaceae bacterium]